MKIEPNLIEYIAKTNLEKKEFSLFKRIPALIKDPIDNNIIFKMLLKN